MDKEFKNKYKTILLNTIKLLVVIWVGVFLFEIAENEINNLDKEEVHRLKVINEDSGEVLYQFSGTISIKPNIWGNKLTVYELKDGEIRKHVIRLEDNMSYILEEIEPDEEASVNINEF